MEEEQKNLGNDETKYKSQKSEKAPLARFRISFKSLVLNLRHSDRRVSTTSIKLKAFSIAKQEKIEDFKGSDQLCNRFSIEISLVCELLLRLIKACL